MDTDHSLAQGSPATDLRSRRQLGAILIALGMALLGTPNRFEGPSLLHLASGHGVSVSDVIALLPLAAGGILMVQALWRQRHSLVRSAPSGANLGSTDIFVAGLAVGIFMARVFTLLPWGWLLIWTAIMVLLLAQLVALRRS